jgi:O-antigen ligase
VNHFRRTRQTLAWARLAMLYSLACGLIAMAAFFWQTALQSGVGLQRSLPAAASPGADPPFAGINVQLAGVSAQAAESRLGALHAAGFGWARQQFSWRKIETDASRFDWVEADQVVTALIAANLEPVAVLNRTPDWALSPVDRAAGNEMAPPADFADFARFAEAFAQRYGERIRYYQIWDEPNIAPHWGSRHINPVEYAQMLRAVVPAIRAADADAVILAAALAPTIDRGHLAIDEAYFLQRMIAAGATPFFDVVALQPFGFGFSPHNPRQQLETLNFARAALIRRTLVDAGLGDKPIWAVRYGWNRMINSPWGSVTPSMQAGYAYAALERAWTEWPWLAAMGWVIDQPAEAPGMPVWGFALTNVGGTPALVLAALARWQTALQPERITVSPALPLVEWVALLLAAALVGWRAIAAARLINWRGGLAHYRTVSPWVHLAVWGALIAGYYLATFPPLILLGWIVAALLCLAQPQVGLWLAVALIPFFYQHKEVQVGSFVLTVPPTHVFIVALLPAIFTQWRKEQTTSSALAWWELPPLLLIPMSILATVNVWHWPAYVRGVLDLVIAPLLLWLAIRVLVHTEQERKRTTIALFTGGVFVAIVGLVGWLHNTGAAVDGIQRLVGPHFSPNHTALYLERTLFVGLATTIFIASTQRVASLIAVFVVAAALVLTGSRGALVLGLPTGLIVIAGFAFSRRPALRRWLRLRRDVVRLVLLLAGALILGLFIWQRERLANLETVELRLELWLAALALWRDHFWAGVGPGGFFWRYPAYLPVGAVEVDQLHPHSLWLELVTTWGVWGLAWFALSCAAFGAALHRRRDGGATNFWIAAGACAGLVAGLAHAQTDTFLLLADLAAWNAVAWALATTPAAESLASID